MKVLVTGSGGMLGKALKQTLRKFDLICPKKHELNVGNFEQVIGFVTKRPECIIHLSSETDHEYCDINPSNCYFINTIGTANVTTLAKIMDIPIIYISTASIFDGTKNAPYTESDKANPINHYNRSKYYGELMVKDHEKHYILRAGWLFGGGPDVDKKFVNKIMKKIHAGDESIMVAEDCVGSPTYTFDLADFIKNLLVLEMNYDYGVYNTVNESPGISRYEFAKAIVEILNIDDVEIIPCSIDDLKEEFPCRRTNYEVLKSTINMPNWYGSLRGYLLANYND